MPSRPSSATPSGSPIAPIAVVSSPGRTTTCTPVVARRSLTASTSASVAPGVMTIIIRPHPTSVRSVAGGMTKTRTLALAAACTMTGAGGALATDAITTSAHQGHHHNARAGLRGGDASHFFGRTGRGLGRAVYADAVVVTADVF